MVTIGTGPDDWELYRGLAAEHTTDGFVCHTVGLHPCSVDSGWEAAVAGMEARWNLEPRPVALGECGLDRFHLPKEPEEAARIFGWQQSRRSWRSRSVWTHRWWSIRAGRSRSASR
jgi:TatD DNase family protein